VAVSTVPVVANDVTDLAGLREIGARLAAGVLKDGVGHDVADPTTPLRSAR
jgi:hypothetical protein